MCSRRFIALLLAFSLFGLSSPSLSYSEDTTSLTVYESDLNRLKVISARLQEISIQLDLKLSASEKSLQSLRDELESLKVKLADIRNRLTISLDRSDQLAGMLEKSESSLEKLTESFKEYKDAAETKIKRLDRKVKALTFVAVLIGGSAIAAGTAWAVK